MLFLLSFAFLSGLVTIMAPCIWPLLPIVLSVSASGRSHSRPLGITLGIISSFGVLTLSVSYAVRLLHFNPDWLRLGAVLVIAFMGMVLLIPRLSQIMEIIITRLTGWAGHQSSPRGNDFTTGFLTGLVLGIVWTPCAGPILAAIAALASLGLVNLYVILVTTAYVMGVGIPLFIVAFSGQQIIRSSKFITTHSRLVQKIFGSIMIVTALAIYTNFDVYLQASLLNSLPGLNGLLSNWQNNISVTKQLNILSGRLPSSVTVADPKAVLNTDYPAPEIGGVAKWLNTDTPLSVAGLKGKVVLVDFWTYSCVNCVRTIPFLNDWYQKYRDQGFVIIGIHTPEFQFEHNSDNVSAAINMYGIKYPVALDNSYVTWQNYANQYWPAEYLIDTRGVVRRTHFGEGEYDKMEEAIQTLLADAGKTVTENLATIKDQTPRGAMSPETYLGSNRMQYYYPGGNTGIGRKMFTPATNLPEGTFCLGGEWNIGGEKAITGPGASLILNFLAKKVFLVMGPGTNGVPVQVKVYLDGVFYSRITVDTYRLYTIFSGNGTKSNHLMKLEFDLPGTEIYAFTFG